MCVRAVIVAGTGEVFISIFCFVGIPANSDVEGGVRGAVGGILLEPLNWHQLLTPKGWKRLTTEGHTFADAILTVAMAQIGEYCVMLHVPVSEIPLCVCVPVHTFHHAFRKAASVCVWSNAACLLRTPVHRFCSACRRHSSCNMRDDFCICRPGHACLAPPDVSHRHHSRMYSHGRIWLVQHMEYVDPGHLLHGTEKQHGDCKCCHVYRKRCAHHCTANGS